MKRFFVLLIVLVAGVSLAMAQDGGKGRPSFEEFLNQKTNYIVKEMELDDATALKFRPLYEELQKAKGALYQKYGNAHRDLRREMKKNNGIVPDQLYLQAVKNEAQIEFENAQLERDYLNKFEMVLTPKQLYDYMRAEKKFKAQFWDKGRQKGKTKEDTRKGERKRN